MSFSFADLFAGIGGFHGAMSASGGKCVFVSEIDREAAQVYERNWGHEVRPAPGRPVVEGDIVALTEPQVGSWVPELDVLCAGFPCQPFSKSGHQRGINETRGTLFFNIARMLEARRPSVILLENVRNLAGPRHFETWHTIVATLRDLGYRVSSTPSVLSPHRIHPSAGGAPQVRDRVFILGTYVGPNQAWRDTDVAPTVVRTAAGGTWDPSAWSLEEHLPLDQESPTTARYRLSGAEVEWVDVWDELVQALLEARSGDRLPGFPLWADAWRERPRVPRGTPTWKADFLRKNSAFYVQHQDVIETWWSRHPEFFDFPVSRRKLEWQAQDEASLWNCVMHFRPSGIRAKRPTYAPALVAITQTSVLGPRRRRMTPGEAARLQGLPEWFDFGEQPDAATYKQLGNGVSVGAAYHVFRRHVLSDPDVAPQIRDAVLARGDAPELPQAAGKQRRSA